MRKSIQEAGCDWESTSFLMITNLLWTIYGSEHRMFYQEILHLTMTYFYFVTPLLIATEEASRLLRMRYEKPSNGVQKTLPY